MLARFCLAALLLVGQAHAQNVATNPIFSVVQSTAPALDINFLSTTLDSRVTFSRASTRSCTNSSGAIVSVAVDVPCMDYAPGTLALKGLSVEAASTNQVFPSINWVTNATASGSVDGAVQSAATAPDGTTTAEKLIPGSFSAAHQWFRGWPGAINTTYAASVYVKAAGWNYVALSLENSSFTTAQFAVFNLSNGTIPQQSANSTGTILALANGWYRISVQNTSNGTSGNYIANIIPQPTGSFASPTTGDAVSGVLVWGQQVEVGYAPTSYIPTTGSTVTRAADVAYVNVVGLNGINGNTGSLFAQVIYEAPAAANNASRWLSLNDGNNPNGGTEFGFEGGGAVDGLIGNQATRTPMNNIISPTTIGASYRLAISFNALNAAQAAGSTSYPTAARVSGSTPLSLTILNFAQPQRFQGQPSLWFQRVTYYPAYLGPNWATNKASGAIP